ncbi:unnamed protein product [Phytophthora fragariaefolia]|uniref:Unnamed protein product n=1 Tax=Phytophthora fragariaefolia TaxID=1490495 RepID=A0A9W6Y1B0_9STRA|nr:unnamed protein product [Phytophthora fragariaefolia]
MVTSGKRPPRMDVNTMYPNFYAEQHKHHVQENNTMAVASKRREGSGGTTRRDGYGSQARPPSRNGLLQLHPRIDQYHNVADVPSCQPDMPSVVRTSRTRGSKREIPPISATRSNNQHEGVPRTLNKKEELAAPGTMISSLRPPSRQVALRGELSFSSPAWEDSNTTDSIEISPRLRPLSFPTALDGSARLLLEAATARSANTVDGQSLEDFVMNACPRTRYARRELHRQGSARTLARISTAPTTLRGQQFVLDGTTARGAVSLTSSRSAHTLHSHSTSADLYRRPTSLQFTKAGAVKIIEAALPGTDLDDDPEDEEEDANFFLTELEAAARAASAAAAAKLRVLARHIALGSFLLYGNPPAFVAAIKHFTRALRAIEGSEDAEIPSKFESHANLALKALLHHHRGVALRELVVASSSTTSKAASVCTKHAFAAQRRALELAQRAQDPRLQARAAKTMGLLLMDAHAYGPALTHQQEALQIALEEKDRELEARVYANLGNLALAQVNFGHALSCHHRDLHLCSSKVLDCQLGRARAHRNLSIVYAKLHRRDLQVKHEKEAREAQQSAYLNDIARRAGTSVGNICFQPSSDIDPALVDIVSQNLAEIVHGLSMQPTFKDTADNDSIASALAEEWRTAEIDLEAAITAVETTKVTETSPIISESLVVKTAADSLDISQSLFVSPVKSPPAPLRHVSIRINNHKPAAPLAQPEDLLHNQ